MGGERPRELPTIELNSSKWAWARNSEMTKFAASKGLEINPTVKCFPNLIVAFRTCGELTAIRHALRLPEDASTATVSGCRSSVREMTGNRSSNTQTIATDSIRMLCRRFSRDTLQRNRHSQTAAMVTATQMRLRVVSIILLPTQAAGRCEQDGALHYEKFFDLIIQSTMPHNLRANSSFQVFNATNCTVPLVPRDQR